MIIIANHIFSGMNRTELKAVSWFDLAIEALGWYADASKIYLPSAHVGSWKQV